ncbi:MAG: integration host factor subunit alpha [Desulfatiglandales bacterium]
MTLTKNTIVEDVVKLGFTYKRALDISETLLEIMKMTLAGGEDVLISGFGKFCIKQKKQRRGRNPATGDDLMLSERKVVTFRPSSILRDRINGN